MVLIPVRFKVQRPLNLNQTCIHVQIKFSSAFEKSTEPNLKSSSAFKKKHSRTRLNRTLTMLGVWGRPPCPARAWGCPPHPAHVWGYLPHPACAWGRLLHPTHAWGGLLFPPYPLHTWG